MRKKTLAALGAAALVAAAMAGPAGASSAKPEGATSATKGKATNYVVLLKKGASTSRAATDLKASGAKVTSVNTAIGMVTVTTTDTDFRANGKKVSGVQGVAEDRSIGRAPERKPSVVQRENLVAAKAGDAKKPKPHGSRSTGDPLDSNLWGMRMIHADEAHKQEKGDKRVRVGVMDTGVQADHPDIHPNFDYKLSRNFTTDIPAIDGPCESASCVDPVGEDDNGHGTHVSGTIAGALNGFGVSGVAPNVDIVEVRAGQDSGYFFVGPTVNALTYSGDKGLDAVNMSFYVDPWLYNCKGGAPEDTPEQAADQDVIIQTMNRALDYAHEKGVTMLAAAGNENTDMANPGTDTTSPDYGEPAHPRTIDNATCSDLPVEGPHVLGLTALGPSSRKSDFSNYTTEPRSGEVELSAPGGWYRDGFGTPTYKTNGNLILSSVPLVALQDTGEVYKDGNITPKGEGTGVIKQCQAKPAKGTTRCGYYAWFQGTSMATPHATGVAALAISAHGKNQGTSGFGMNPDAVRDLMMRSATDHACPAGGVQDYTKEGRGPEYTARCVGTPDRNGFYGDGIVNALGVVAGSHGHGH
jgi:subtilisin family serine protease